MSQQSFLGGKVVLHGGDSRDVLKTIADNSIDSMVCDPPYALVSIVKRFGSPNAAPAKGNDAYARASAGFMGKQWDTGEVAFSAEFWAEVLRVMKPGAHLVAFSGTRTYHRMTCAIEDAGFEIRDQIGWAYGSGFPKSHDVSKGIDKAAGAEREVVGSAPMRMPQAQAKGWGNPGTDTFRDARRGTVEADITAPATDTAKQWQGWGTALKPSYEPLCVAQKPLDYGQNIAIIGSHVALLWSRLWSMLSAKDAAKLSALSPAACGVDPSAFAQWNAESASNTRAALCDQMGTSPFASALISSLSTVSSWNDIWAAASAPENTSIIETELSTTIGWRTLRFLLSKITVENIIRQDQGWSMKQAHQKAESDAIKQVVVVPELSCPALQHACLTFPWPWLLHWSPILPARKPPRGTVAANVLEHGVGALNIDGCRIESGGEHMRGVVTTGKTRTVYGEQAASFVATDSPLGRWPANLLHDGSEEVLKAFPETCQPGCVSGSEPSKTTQNAYDAFSDRSSAAARLDAGSAARFFYTAKADADDRIGSKHPTVKPVDLMQWLVRLVTPKGGTVLDPFAGTGTTGEAAGARACAQS